MIEPTAVEIRVLGCLLEKQRTTPDAYPLTLNALRLACNQATNRDPVLELDEAAIREALARLSQRRWTRAASGAGSRAPKYRQLFDEALELSAGETALLTLLMLRGPQTQGELNGRSERLHRFAGLDAVGETLARLEQRGLAERLPRRPGEKGERWRQTIGAGAEEGEGGQDASGDRPAPPSAAEPSADAGEQAELRDRVAALERELAAVRDELRSLREALGE